ncbi:MAG: phosphatase PAP2 family protein [Bacteroidota bacterium]
MTELLRNIDVSLFLWLNGKHNDLFDTVMYWASHKLFWIWFYVILLALVAVRLGKKTFLVLPAVALMILLSDQGSGLIKRSVQRKRPCHSEHLAGRVHVNGSCGGAYGFVSSHAANTFALAFFLSLLIGKAYRWLPYLLFAWAFFVSYSRIYNGVHYPADILGGAVVGMLSAWLAAKLYFYANIRLTSVWK